MTKTKQPQHSTRAVERNGIKAPQRPGKCMTAWDLFDTATGPIACAHMQQLASLYDLNEENLRIELRRYKRFNGIPAGVRAAVTVAVA